MNPKPTTTTTRSYSRTIQVAPYTPISGFMSLSHQWYDEEPTAEEIRSKAKALYEMCREIVETQLLEDLERLKVGEPTIDVNAELQKAKKVPF